MIRYKLTYLPTREVYVSLDVDRADAFAPLVFEGGDFPVELVRDHLLRSTGMDGHNLEAETTALDLDAAMRSAIMARFEPQLVSGAEVLRKTSRTGRP